MVHNPVYHRERVHSNIYFLLIYTLSILFRVYLVSLLSPLSHTHISNLFRYKESHLTLYS